MTCCRKLKDGKKQQLPFKEILATDFYDGPRDGATKCRVCGRTFAFRMLDWDDEQERRVFGFAPIRRSFTALREVLVPDARSDKAFHLVRPPSRSDQASVLRMLNRVRPVYVTCATDLSSRTSIWKRIATLESRKTKDWFFVLGMERHSRMR